MRVLFVSAECPAPPLGGPGLRLDQFARGLAGRHEVHILCCGTVRQELDAREYLGSACSGLYCVPAPEPRGMSERAIDTLVASAPDLALRFRGSRAGDTLRNLTRDQKFDVVHLMGLEAAALAGEALHGPELRGARVVLDELNAEYVLQERAARGGRDGPRGWAAAGYSWIQARKLRSFETGACGVADGVLAVSAQDAAALRRLQPLLRLAVVPNGVDTRRYSPEALAALSGRSLLPPGGPVLLFTGTMDFRPNADAVEWFARTVLPRVLMAAPDVRLVVAGRNPTRRVLELGGPNVLVTGAVPDDLPYFAAAAVFVLPMRFGGGSRLKLLQALSCALPVVSTRAGAAGVPLHAGQHALLGDSPDEFARAVLWLLEHPDHGARLGGAGRSLAERFDWKVLLPRLERFYGSFLAASPRTHIQSAPVLP